MKKLFAGARFLCVLVALVLSSASQTASVSASGPHFSDVNILLPPRMTHPVEYRLQGTDGCFKWSWDHHDFLAVIPEYNSSNHCSTGARLRSIAPYSGRKETAVYAAEVRSGMVIRFKVFIDMFARIQIFHKSVKLDLDGLATLRVQAFDGEDNVFSSLVGLRFLWKLTPETDGLPHHLAHVPLKDSPLSDCGGFCGDLDVQIKLEDSGVFSDVYAAKGVEIGLETVSVSLYEPGFEPMADKIVLTVAEAMSIEPPSPVYVIVGAVVRYTLKVIHGNIPQVVTLPSLYHRWSVSNSSVAQMDSTIGTTNALQLGATDVIVEDTRVAGHTQVSSLRVVVPGFLSIYIEPWPIAAEDGIEAIPSRKRWYVVSGRQYLIQIKVFTQGPDGHEIYITESDDIKLFDDQTDNWKLLPLPDHMAITRTSWNSRVLKPTSQGLGKLIATLSYFIPNNEIKEDLNVMQEVMVCEQVKFHLEKISGKSETILLPWAPGIHQKVKLKALGGCAEASNDYKWSSSDMSVVTVSPSGVVEAKKPGKATIKVFSVYDSLNYDEVLVEVSVPVSMVMLRNFPVETVVGSDIHATVTMKAPNGAFFYRCDAFSSSIKWNSGTGVFMIGNATRDIPVSAPPHGSPCSWTSAYASHAGNDMLHATLSKESNQFDGSIQGPVFLKASSRIAAYPPLVVRQAGDGNQFGGYWFDLSQGEAETETDNRVQNLEHLYLAPGTYLDVLLLGGPEQWDQSVNFIENFKISGVEFGPTEVGVDVQRLSGGRRSLYRVLCQTLGNFKVSFERGNLVVDDHPYHVIEKVLMSLTCDIPNSVAVLADEPVNELKAIQTAIQADRSSGRLRVTPITVANGRTIRIAAVGTSNTGAAFANSSSIDLKWDLSGCDDLAYWDDDASDVKRTKYSWERVLRLDNKSGLCIVRAAAIRFNDAIADHIGIQLPESLDNVLTDAIRLQIVSSIRVSPEFNLLFFNPNAKVNLSIIGGSCFLEAFVNDSQVVEVVKPPSGTQCLHLLLAPKGLGKAVVTVYDIGLAPPTTASSVVQVVDLDWINITSPDEISIMVGSLQTFDLMAGINSGSTFDSSQFAYMKIQVHIKDQIVEFVDSGDKSSLGSGHLSKPTFNIVARYLGTTTLYVSAVRQSGNEIFSQPIKVEVYAPPRIHPQDIFLAPGASFVVTLRGGPTIGVDVEYTTMDDGIATIHKSSGHVSAISTGNTTILASVFGNGGTIICQAYGTVKVGVPSVVMLNAQSKQLAIGCEMPIYPLFSEGDLFSFYELCRSYQWSIEDEKVLSLYPSEHLSVDKHGVQMTGLETDQKELDIINILYGRSSGKTKVTVSFSCEFKSSGSKLLKKFYNASISIVVVPDLPLDLGFPTIWLLPPHYTTERVLPSSSESHSQGDTPSGRGSVTYSLRNFNEKSEMAQETSSISGDRIRTAEINDLACIQAKDRSTARTSVAACIKVAEVSQIRITNREFPIHAIRLSVGAELSHPVTYRDILGNPFYEAHDVVAFDVVTNYPDVVFINNTNDGSGNIHIKAIRQGSAVLRVSIDGIPQKSDYLLISVGAHIHPQNHVVSLGGHVNFSIEGLTDHVSGSWATSNSSIISVDVLSGIAEAVGEGTTQVHFEAQGLKLQTTATVLLSGDIVSVDAPKELLTNVAFPENGYGFPVQFRSKTCTKKLNAHGNCDQIMYDCRVDPAFVGYVRPWSDLDTGNSYCLFSPYSPGYLVDLMPKTKGMKQHMPISVHVSSREAQHISGSASARFVGGFSMLDIRKLNLTPDFNKTVITIVGNTGVEFYWQERKLLLISPIYKEDFGIGSRAQYEVKVLGNKKFSDKITILLPATGQNMEIDVCYEPKPEGASTQSFNIFRWETVLIFIFILILTMIYLIRALDRPIRRQQQRPVYPSPSRAEFATPDRGSPPASSDESPRTPQAFIDYVRRTVDETPYYRRDGRRFNPQNTY